MATPVIEDASGSVITYPGAGTVGVPLVPFRIYADNATPGDGAVWTATGLPPGVSIRSVTAPGPYLADTVYGEIYGTPTAAWGTNATVRVELTNGNFDTALLSVVVRATPAGSPSTGVLWDDLELDFDLGTREVTIPGSDKGADGSVFRAAKGDKFNLLVGLKKYGVLQDPKPGFETVTIRVAAKEFEEERVIELAGGSATKVGSADNTRFRIAFELEPGNWSLLGDYEGDRSTGRPFPAQLEVAVAGTGYDRFCSDTFLIGITRDQIPD